MKMFILFIAFIVSCNAIPIIHQGRIFHGNHQIGKMEKFLQNDVNDINTSNNILPEAEYYIYVTQPLDHFNRNNNITFQQRYFVNTTYWKGDVNAPVFLCVGGEGPALDSTVLYNSVHCNDMTEIAPKYNALLLALEHRYYGNSCPFGNDFSTKNMQWLNTEQALGDIANFYYFITQEYKLSPTNKWITFGGSYPGMVAALARLRYPHLIYGSISSSAPLRAEVEMQGYNNVVAESMGNAYVGGSTDCLNAIIDSHKVVGDMLATADGRRHLETDFNICRATTHPLDDPKNQEAFCGDGVVFLPVQSNDPSCTSSYCNIAKICSTMTDTTLGNSYQRLMYLTSKMNGGGCVSANYQSEVTFYELSSNPERSWFYQTCTEWGFYQTCASGSQCPYTQGLHTIQSDYDLCYAAFKIDSATVDQSIQNALNIYGGDNIQSSNIFFVNGEVDPWHANSVLTSPNPNEPTLWVKGSSHHFWTHPTLPTDDINVINARKAIWAQLDIWITGNNNNNNNNNNNDNSNDKSNDSSTTSSSSKLSQGSVAIIVVIAIIFGIAALAIFKGLFKQEKDMNHQVDQKPLMNA